MPLHDPAHAFVPYPDAPVPHAPTGPLADLSFAAKDLFDVAGYPTGGGSPIVLAMSGIKTRTAPTVQKLLDAFGVDSPAMDRASSIALYQKEGPVWLESIKTLGLEPQ